MKRLHFWHCDTKVINPEIEGITKFKVIFI